MNKKPPLKIGRKLGVRRGKNVTLRPKVVRTTQDIGGGFFRHEFQDVTIAPNQFLTIRLIPANTNRRVISAGWTITGFLPAYATDSFPFSTNQWNIIIHNPTSSTRTISTYLITKLP